MPPTQMDASAKPAATPFRISIAARLREVVQENLSTYSFDNASFYADKLVSLDPSPAHVALLARTHFFKGEFSRALGVLQNSHCVPGVARQEEVFQGKRLCEDVGECVLLAARCLEASKEWQKCLQMLSCFDQGINTHDAPLQKVSCEAGTLASPAHGIPWGRALRGAVYSLAGRCNDELDRRQQAELQHSTALAWDPYSWTSFLRSADLHFPMANAIAAFTSLNFDAPCFQSDPLAPVARELYSCKLSVWVNIQSEPPLVPYPEKNPVLLGSATVRPPTAHPPSGELVMPEEQKLAELFGWENTFVLQCRAERLYYAHYTLKSHAAAKKVLELDAYNDACCVLLAACLVALKKRTDLYQLGHEIANRSPNSVVAWYVIACYYFASEDYDRAGKYFYRATISAPSFLPAWIAYGHTFHALDEGEHTITAYRSALRLFPGCHLAALYMGMEHAKGCNLQHAHTFFDRSVSLLGGAEERDPTVCNEMGVMYFKGNSYGAAKRYFLKALWRWRVAHQHVPEMADFADESAMLQACLPSTADVMRDAFWEPAIFNLGHTYRKLRMYNLALRCYNICLAILPHDASILGAIAFTHHLMAQYDEAIAHYHTSLSTRSNDAFCRNMLSRAIKESFEATHREEVSPIMGTSTEEDSQQESRGPVLPTSSPLFSEDMSGASPSMAWEVCIKDERGQFDLIFFRFALSSFNLA